jgi:type IX secretion system PorP/SprF family membrane protein
MVTFHISPRQRLDRLSSTARDVELFIPNYTLSWLLKVNPIIFTKSKRFIPEQNTRAFAAFVYFQLSKLIMKRFLRIAVIVLVFPLSVSAQDPHFSQFFASPLSLNPALTGRFDGNLRLAGNYRSQWPTIDNAFKTFTASADFAVMQNKLPDIDRWGMGFMALADEQADGVLKNTYFSFSTAYHKGLDENGYHQVSVGFQGTYAQKRLNTSNLKFEDQLRSDGFTGITAEIFDPQQVNINYFDLNAGILFSGVTGANLSYYVGSSVYHINTPRESFTGADFALQPRYTVHGGAYFPLSKTTLLHTTALYQAQAGASEVVVGGALGINIGRDVEFNPVTFYVGSWYRFQDAIIPYVGMEFGSMRLGGSYDVNTSALKSVSSSRGGFEVSLIYINQPKTDSPIKCPKF